MELELSGFYGTGKNHPPRRFLKNCSNENQSLLGRNGLLQQKRAAVHLDESDPDSFLFNSEEFSSTADKPTPTKPKPPKIETPVEPREKKPKESDRTTNTKSIIEDDDEESYDRFCFTCGYVNNCSDTCFTKDDQGNLVNNFCIEF